MTDGIFDRHEVQGPRLEPEIPTPDEIENDITRILARHPGDEAIPHLVEYVQLSLTALMTTIESHGRLERLPVGAIERIRRVELGDEASADAD